nr:hypothetical protein [Tanacetum cinerariifolium]GEY73712.1 hypothetical protein [Tanacetum cinerariifolium]
MEQKLLSSFEQVLNTRPQITSLQPFSMARSLIVNPSTSDQTISSIIQTLETLSKKPQYYLLTVITLLYEISATRPHFTTNITTILHSLSVHRPTIPPSAAALALSLVPTFSNMTEGLFLSLCFSQCVSVRQRLLTNANKFDVRPSILLTMLLWFTKDPYPFVRKAALDGLIGLCKCIVVEDRGMVEGCYLRGVEMLGDTYECVRCSAVEMVSEWGKILVETSKDEIKRDWSDVVYVQLCSMARDMSLNVRINAFNALGNVGVVSNYILLQTLSKRIDKELPRRLSVKHFNLQISTGAFVHGLEDEFCEVRSSACYSIRIPAISSATCAAGALDLLMDVLNDDSAIVRLQALQTMHHMAVLGHLKVQEMHMHMFLGTLADMNASIRITARKVLRLTKLHDLPLFELVADSLIQSLESYPQDEPDVLSLMFDMGRSHGSFAVSIAKEIFSEIEPSSESNWDFNSSKNAAQLALAISAPLSHRKQQQLYTIPAAIFSYAVTMLGRISNGLTGTMDQDTLLAYLSHCSTSTVVDPTELTDGEDKVVQMVEDDMPKEMDSLIAITHVVDKLEVHGRTLDYVKFILVNTAEVWPLIKSGCINEVLMTVRSWKEELATYITYSCQSDSVLAFALQYLHVVKLLSKAWWHVMCRINSMHNIMSGDLGYIMQKLERRLAEFKYRFIRLSEEEELHIEELTLVACSLRLSLFDVYLQESALKKMISTKSRLLFLYKETSTEPSRFVTELKEILQKNDSDIFRFRESLELFTLKKLVFTGNFQYMKAEVDIRDNNWSNPLPFVAGLPVGIPLKIRLHNIPIGTKLWLMLKLSKEVNQHVFLDLKQFEGSEKIREFTFIAPFYRTPKVNSFILRLSTGIECLSEDIRYFRGHGPKHDLVYLCKEKEVFFSMISKQS